MGEPVVKCLKNFLILKYFIEYSFIFVEEVQNSVQLLARIKYTVCIYGTVAPWSINQYFLWSYISA